MKETTKKATLGIAGATMAAAAGAYYLYGSKKAAAHRRAVNAWMRRAEREIVHEAKRLKNAAYTDATIKKVINHVAQRYEAARDLNPDDVKNFVSAVQKSWSNAGSAVQRRLEGVASRGQKSTRSRRTTKTTKRRTKSASARSRDTS